VNGRLTAARAFPSEPGEFSTWSQRDPRLAAGSHGEANGATSRQCRRFRWRLCVSFAVGLVAISLATANPAAGDPGDDEDYDGTADAFDNCPASYNPGQQDSDANGRGDACDPADSDYDGRNEIVDNCPSVYNRYQADGDGDGRGDVCDPPITHTRVIPVRTNPVMSSREARRYVRLMIRARTHRSPTHLRRRCVRLGYRSYRCRAEWSTADELYYGRVVIRHIVYGREVYWAYEFRGRRTRRSCLSHTSPAACCGHRVHWT
jgi:Thrombospondin type 3 repeat